MPKIILIAALDENGLIGLENGFPWPKIKADLKYFKETTLGHTIVMGRKTFESLGSRPLPGRKNIILTRDANFAHPDCEVATSVEQILKRPEEKTFICGGGKIYEQFLPHADQLYLTYIAHSFSGDTYFPVFNKSEWKLVSEAKRGPDAETAYPLRFTVWERV